MTKKVLQTLLEEIKKKNSWGKNELIALIAEISAEAIDREPAVSPNPLGTFQGFRR